MPPGHEPMPSTSCSVPRAGMLVQAGEHDVEEDRPVQEKIERFVHN